ncbi:response regulator [Desulfopila sp. IMCC35008]|uniref:response regulator n=1 Tax=Desulfopila sp. IMCC35008 TaxID=2653858 RepID=UPI0013D5C91D|nr:response regulator [Desulfopila sp. IMCC35008]
MHNQTVLLIEDDTTVLKIACVMLTRLGYSVLTAEDGLEAIEVFQRHKYEIRLVLSDFAMPHLDGMKTLQELRKIVPGIPMILASGHSEENVMRGSFKERPACFLQKPYNLQALKDAIDLTLR